MIRQLTSESGFALSRICGAIADIQRLKPTPFKHSPDIRVIVDANHHFALACPNEVGNSLVFIKAKLGPVPLVFQYWVGHIVKGMGPILLLGALQPRKILDVCAG